MLKLIAAKPDAIVIGASGTPAALPARALVEHGYKGKLYFNHGVANNDFLRVGGKDVEGAFVPASPVIVAAQLPDGHPAKKRAEEYIKLYEAAYGAGSVSAFGSYTWDACLELANAIPHGAQERRSPAPSNSAARCATRSKHTKNLDVTNGAVNMSKTDHLGLDSRARVMVQIQNGSGCCSDSEREQPAGGGTAGPCVVGIRAYPDIGRCAAPPERAPDCPWRTCIGDTHCRSAAAP